MANTAALLFWFQSFGHKAGNSPVYSHPSKYGTQNIWSKEELCDMAGLLFHSEANERRPRCQFWGWSDDSRGILSVEGPFILVDLDWQLGLPVQHKGYTELLYVARERVAGHSRWSHSAPTCPVFSVFSTLRGRMAAQLVEHDTRTLTSYLGHSLSILHSQGVSPYSNIDTVLPVWLIESLQHDTGKVEPVIGMIQHAKSLDNHCDWSGLRLHDFQSLQCVFFGTALASFHLTVLL